MVNAIFISNNDQSVTVPSIPCDTQKHYMLFLLIVARSNGGT